MKAREIINGAIGIARFSVCSNGCRWTRHHVADVLRTFFQKHDTRLMAGYRLQGSMYFNVYWYP